MLVPMLCALGLARSASRSKVRCQCEGPVAILAPVSGLIGTLLERDGKIFERKECEPVQSAKDEYQHADVKSSSLSLLDPSKLERW